MPMSFTYDFYSALLEKLRSSGYRLTSFRHQEDRAPNQAIIRHDVDISPEKAVEMAELETRIGVSSTYFFMLSSDMYNIMSAENEEAMLEIHRMGHEIGLHFDHSKYLSIRDDKELEQSLMNEIRELSTILSYPVKSVSWHKPPKDAINRKYDFLDDCWIRNAYDPKFFSEHKYLSDSNMRWREDPMQFIDKDRFPKLQILTHPVWYWEYEREKHEILNIELGKKAVSSIRYLEAISPGYMRSSMNHV